MEDKIRISNKDAKSKDVWRSLISIVLGFLLTLFIVVFTLLMVIQWSGFSRGSFYDNMSKNNYYDYVLDDIMLETESITLPIGLPINVLDDVFSSYQIGQDVNAYIDASFDDLIFVPDTSKIEKLLEKNSRKALEDQGIIPNEEQENNLDNYIKAVVEIYKDKTKMPLLSVFDQAKDIYKEVFMIGIISVSVCMIIILLIIIKIHVWIHRAMRYISYSLISAGLMVGIVPGIILESGFYKKVHLSPEYFYNFVTDYVTNILKLFIYYGIAWILIAILVIAILESLKKSKGYKKKRKNKVLN